MDIWNMNVPRASNAAHSGTGETLTCVESMQRAPSPILFPENVPGAGKHNTEHDGMCTSKQKSFRTDLSPDDVKLVNGKN
ncbi:hypothetical protein KIN20_032069 [Parelaphostrongylus tenuis]|uniref:Uncharacterized protein n=1 Tax=Parelaphostrongylus tenuis TaxID=148309 RepID=A0AAD5R6E9_PARTN|nr:hypothetical protein KIN20_032069 [Parelaphostrongylus tenuis]